MIRYDYDTTNLMIEHISETYATIPLILLVSFCYHTLIRFISSVEEANCFRYDYDASKKLQW